MSKLFTKPIAFLLLVMLMANMAVWGFSGAKLKHEIEHNGVERAPASHQHASLRLAGDTSNDHDKKLSAFEHQVLHAVDHVQLFPGTALSGAFLPVAAGTLSTHFVEQFLPLSTYDTPYRPPCRGALTA